MVDLAAVSTVNLDPAAFLTALGAIIIGYLGYRRGIRKDQAGNDLLEFAQVTEAYARLVKDSRDQVHFIRNEAQKNMAEIVLQHKHLMDLAEERFRECEQRLEERVAANEKRLDVIENGGPSAG